MDVAFQLWLKTLQKKLVTARMKGGSGLQLSTLLRGYFLEYAYRWCKYGPGSFPASFNVVEAFMSFKDENMIFDLRDEVEHLLPIDDYFRWYDTDDIPKKPEIVGDMLQEGTVYSYDMVSDANSLRIVGMWNRANSL